MSEPGAPAATAGVAALAEQARAVVDDAAWAYLAGGSGEQRTVRRNLAGWAGLTLLPHVLAGVGMVDASISLLGHALAHPVLVAPTASHGLYHAGGEVETVRGAGESGALAVVSTNASLPVTTVGAAALGPWWFQL